jgi:hypothetical protein
LRELAGFPYFIDEGSMIVVRVSAKNIKGYGQPSNVNVEGLHLKNPIPQ